MEKYILYIALIVYGFWSVRWGIRFVDGRWAVLERPKMRIVKIVVSLVIGFVFGVVYLAARALKFIFVDFPKLLGW